MRGLALEFDDPQIARILNRQGRRSGKGLAFTTTSVLSMRGHHRIPVCPERAPRDEREGPFTADEAQETARVHETCAVALRRCHQSPYGWRNSARGAWGLQGGARARAARALASRFLTRK